MGTRAHIHIQSGLGVKTIYTHWDGYPEHHLPILQENYNTQELAEKLISLGDLSVLDKSADKPEGEHSVDGKRQKGYCLAFGRDRGETGTEARSYLSITSAKNKESEEYWYYWNGQSWEYGACE